MITRMLLAVRSAAEAEQAIAGGADRLVIEARGEAAVAALGATARGLCPVSLRAGDADAATQARCDACGADEIYGTPAVLDGVATRAHRIAVLPAVQDDQERVFERLGRHGYHGAAIGGEGGPQRLLQQSTPADLERQVVAARRHRLAVVFAGPIEPPDVPRLLALAPDGLLLNLAAWGGDAEAAPDATRLALLRDLIPRHQGGEPAAVAAIGHDRIFVRDWTVAIPVGAYSHERSAQQVRFTVEAEIASSGRRAPDLRDIVSYDLITDAIGRSTAAHVDLVETLAEAVARMVLGHPAVVSVDVTVEKLEIGPGRVGCRIRRARPAEA